MTSKKIFHSILFPVDFSEANESIVPHVRGLAELTGASITLLHVIPWLSAWYSEKEVRVDAGQSDLWRLQEQCARKLEIFREQHFAAALAHLEVKVGPIPETISNTAIDLGSDLIMMATRGQGRARRFLIGSTTARVLHDSPCPVWTSPHMGTLQPFANYRHILCAVDRDEIPEGYLEEALRLTSAFGNRLSFVTAIPGASGDFEDAHHVHSLRREFPHAGLLDERTPADCTALTQTGLVGDVVREVAQGQGADLILTDRGHIQYAPDRLRTHSYEIVLESPCPVLSTCLFKPRLDKLFVVRALQPDAELEGVR